MTPLRRLSATAQRLGIAELLVKDESYRELRAFKAVGVEYALDQLDLPRGTTLICASAGNHGRAVARGGAKRGMRVKVYVGVSASETARRAIVSEGAEVIAVDGSYEDAVRRARDDKSGVMISDVAAPDDERVPALIMTGYRRILDEARAQWDAPPNAVIVQVGVGSLAASVVTWMREHVPDARTICCRPADVRHTIMAGLACEELSSLAAPILGDDFVRVTNAQARAAMIALAEEGVVAGPSGAAGVAALTSMQFDANARVLVINTEGATDRALYDSIVGPRFVELQRALAETPERIRPLAANVWHICHLRDIEPDGYTVRVRRVIEEENPFLADIDGNVLAIARRYNEDDPRRALDAFADARRETLALLGHADFTRAGELEGVGPVTAFSLAARLLAHDREHLAAMEAVAPSVIWSGNDDEGSRDA